MTFLRDIEKLIPHHFAQEDRRTPGHRDNRTGASRSIGAHDPDRACTRPGAMKAAPVRKALAVTPSRW